MNWDVLDTPEFRVPYAALLIESYIEMMVAAFIYSGWFWVPAVQVLVLMTGMLAIMQRPYLLEMRRLKDEQ